MKKRILTVALVVALLATCFGGTLAYLKDTDAQVNAFTTGNVYISLDEAVVEKDTDGNLVAKGEERTSNPQNYHLYPGMTVTKDPTIYVEGTEEAYVAAKVIIKDTTSSAAETKTLYDLIGVPGFDNINIHKLASGGLITENATQEFGWNGLSMVYKTDECVIYQDADKTNNTWVLYIFMNGAQKVGTNIALFNTLQIDEKWDNAEMTVINGLEITVEAYATQTNGFADCYTAMTTAFATNDNSLFGAANS